MIPDLLKTIRIPKNIHYLTDRLPKPNYMPLKTRKIDKLKFIQTIGEQLSNNDKPDNNEMYKSDKNF